MHNYNYIYIYNYTYRSFLLATNQPHQRLTIRAIYNEPTPLFNQSIQKQTSFTREGKKGQGILISPVKLVADIPASAPKSYWTNYTMPHFIFIHFGLRFEYQDDEAGWCHSIMTKFRQWCYICDTWLGRMVVGHVLWMTDVRAAPSPILMMSNPLSVSSSQLRQTMSN